MPSSLPKDPPASFSGLSLSSMVKPTFLPIDSHFQGWLSQRKSNSAHISMKKTGSVLAVPLNSSSQIFRSQDALHSSKLLTIQKSSKINKQKNKRVEWHCFVCLQSSSVPDLEDSWIPYLLLIQSVVIAHVM